ncbi:MAG: exo-alpha-sialidase, partial [Thermoplasmata archaeon]|nr:exo-alpha-sialidase [Thermoplasmata archaeon]
MAARRSLRELPPRAGVLLLAALLVVGLLHPPGLGPARSSSVQPATAQPGSIPPRSVTPLALHAMDSAHPRPPSIHSSPNAARPSGQLHNAVVVAPCDSGQAWNVEVQQAYDPVTGYLYEAWIGCGGIGFSRSTDGGYSFGRAIPVPGSTTGPTGPANRSWDPSIALAPNGTVYVAYMVNRSQGDAPVVAWSYDHGASFAGDAYAFRPSGTEFSDRDFLAVAPNGTLYLSWDYSPDTSLDQIGCSSSGSCYFLAGDYNILVVHSSDGGANWSNPVPVDPEYPNGGCPAGPLLVEPGGAIDLLYEDYSVGAGHVLGLGHNYFTRSADGGRTWSAPVRVENGSFSNTSWWINGDLARDRSGTLYATFDTMNGTGDTAGVTLSRDGGATWSATTRLNPDVDHASHIEVAVAGGGNGTAYVAWMGNNSSSGWSTFEATFSGNGTTLGAPVQVSDAFGLNGYWVGDTIGLTYLGLGVAAVSWSYALPSTGTSGVEVYEAVVGESPPGPPTITGATPGEGNATLFWSPPSGSVPVDGYTVVWGVEGQHTFFQNLSSATTRTDLTALQPFARYVIEVSASNTGGPGPFSAPLNLTLTAWSDLKGSVSPTNANVTVDGIGVAVTAGAFFLNSTPGGHILAAGGPTVVPQVVAVTLPWNGTLWQNFTLALLPGSVVGHVLPSGASATWDGISLSLGPGGAYRETGPSGSTHVLSASALGYVPKRANVTLVSNTTVWLNLTLVLFNVTLRLYVTPATADVAVNGTPVVLTSDGRANLSRAPGVYEITATAPGFQPFFENVTLTTGVQPIAVALQATPPAVGVPPSSSSLVPLWVAAVLLAALLGAVLIAAVGLYRRGKTGPMPPGPDVYSGP